MTKARFLCQNSGMNSATPSRVIQVALVVVEETGPAILFSLAEVFSFVGEVWEMMTGLESGPVRMQPQLVAANAEPTECAMGATVRSDCCFSDAIPFDVVIATDILLSPGFDPRGKWPEATAWLREQYQQGALIASVCTGSLLLAEAGLLDDQEATTHWGSTPIFRQCYPSVQLKPEKVLSLSGMEHRVITAGGASSWEELALYLITRYCGAEEANRTAKVFLLGDRSAGQLPFASMTRPRSHDDAIIDNCQAWIAENYDRRNPVAQMVTYSGLTERTFKRRFRSATGYSPIEYVQTLRIEEAKQLLESTTSATDQIAINVGYDDPTTFRRLFKRMTGVTPAKYRRRFQSLHQPLLSITSTTPMYESKHKSSQ